MSTVSDRESEEKKRARVTSIVRIISREYPRPKTALTYTDPFQLLVAVILSAQCTDARVNIVTPDLFRKYSSPRDFAKAQPADLERIIHSTGFFRNKARNIIACSTAIMNRHNGNVPRTMEELHALPGVGRKTANVVLGEAFGKTEGIVVDTHVARLSIRLGLTQEKDAVKIENDLMRLIPKKKWIQFSHSLILHGRKICNARKPLCGECSLHALCPSSRRTHE